MRIYRYGDVIAGWYKSDGGEILGELSDEHTIIGKWIENGSGRTCDTYVYDRKNWGSLLIEFNEDFTQLKATWGYCDDDPTKTNWNGKRK